MNTSWNEFIADTELENVALHVVLVCVPHFMERLKHYQSLLSETERQRNQHPHFVIARGILRVLLGHYLQQPPQSITFAYEAKGKPVLVNQACYFNMSHSHEQVVYIFSKRFQVGIDMEYVQRTVDYLKIAERFFAASEFSYLASQTKERLPAAFFDLWTHKEAYVKAMGLGISDFGNFAVDMQQHPPCVLTDLKWTFVKLPLTLPYQGVYAVEVGAPVAKFFILK